MGIGDHPSPSRYADAAPATEWIKIGGVQLFGIGHSTHPLEEFVRLLASHGIELLADIRTVPRSRKWPHFGTDQLSSSLPANDVAYAHLSALGGWRRPVQNSPNGGWRNPSFQGYADYALTDAFADGLAELCSLARERPTAMMCSEGLWWRCHRRLVADRLVAAGWEVLHIAPDGGTTGHELSDFAVVRADGRVVYPPRDDGQLSIFAT
jgi:uncharacterized protein (DUF488 family)